MEEEAHHHHQEDHVHLHVHLDPLVVRLVPAHKPDAAVTAILTIGGSIMSPVQISIDSSTSEAKLSWIDDKGDTDAAPPGGAQITYGVTDDTVASVDPGTGKLTPLREGAAQVIANIVGPDGGPVMEPDGTTPFSAPPADFQVVAGAAVGAGLEIQA